MPRYRPSVIIRLAALALVVGGFALDHLGGSGAGSAAAVQATGTPAQMLLFKALPTPPDGSMAWAKVQSPTLRGVLDLDQFVQAYFDSAGQASGLTTEQQRGFQYAVRVDWQGDDGSYADAYIVHYSAASGALAFYSGQLKVSTAGYAGAGQVSGITDSKLYTDSTLDSFGNASVKAWAVAGSNVISLYTLTPSQPGTEAASRMIAAEYAAICGAAGCPAAS